MTAPPQERTRARGSRRFVVIGVAVGVGLLAVLAVILGSRVLSAQPAEHNNPSFRYGEDVMRNQLYGNAGGDVDSVCRSALLRPVNPPTPFDLNEAIGGCKYAEYMLDN
jgi:hypothetical protein